MAMFTIKQGDSDSEVIIYVLVLKLSVDLTAIEMYNGWGIYLTSLSLTTCGIVHLLVCKY